MKPKMENQPNRGWVRLLTVFGTYLLITVIIAFLIGGVSGGFSQFFSGNSKEIPVSQLVEDVNAGNVDKVTIEENRIKISYKNGSEAYSRKEINANFYEMMQQAGVSDISTKVQVEVASPPISDFLETILSNLIPIAIMIVFFLFLFRLAGKSAGGVLDFGKSNAKMFGKDTPKVSFKDAAGVAEAKQELEEVVDFLKSPDKYRRLGARIPKGVLLVGPAGTGKTLLARAVANEAGVPFYSMAGSEFMEMLVGVGASRVRDLFRTAKENAPALIFIDEVESIGRQRGRSIMASHGEQEQTLNQILVEMDGFSPNDNVIVIAATNRPDLLDSALTRPGRFDRTVVLQLPDIVGREEIIRIHLRNKPLASDVDITRLARLTVGFSGADIENMLNEAAILAARTGKKEIDMRDISNSATKVKLGPERRHLQSDADKKMTAYHEAGHAIVANRTPGMDPVQRVSIVSRGMALGFTEINPEQDKYHQTKTDLLNRITALLGGRAAEEIVFNDATVGAKSDLEKANIIARKMVAELGMSSLGPVAFDYVDSLEQTGDPILDRSKYSEQMASKIDSEIIQIITDAYKRAKDILTKDRILLDKVVDALMVEETIEQDKFEQIINELSNA
ncbi:ATP-dependent zinc metalloprotease FtsH [candidate division WWE3 bacterium]|nr:ATP-dependent zinc metalloprotease FtsH [candidate division WWE3 bacterium]